MSERWTFRLGFLITLAMLSLIIFCARAHGQTFIVQGGVAASHALGDRPGPSLEARATLPWLYTRFNFAWTPKVYLGSGNLATGDVLVRAPYHSAWFGGGIEISRAQTSTYSKTAKRVLIGGGLEHQRWTLAGFIFPHEWSTPNKSIGGRADLSFYHKWLALTVRPFVLYYHDSIQTAQTRTGYGIEALVGIRWEQKR